MAFEDCVARIAKAGGISKEMARELFSQVHDLAEAKKLTGEKGPELAAALELAGKFKEEAKNKKLDALRNAAIRTQIIARTDTEGGIKGAGYMLRTLLHWMPGAKFQNSIESMWHSTQHIWQSAVGNKLRQEGLENVAISGGLDYDVGEEMWKWNAAKEEGKAAFVPSNSVGAKIAAAISPALDLMKERMNAAGAHIGTAFDYVTKTNWDSRQLRLAAGKGADIDTAFQAWWKVDGPRMAEKTFDGLVPKEGETIAQARERFGRSVYEATVTGVHNAGPTASFVGQAADDSGYVPPAYEGTRNLAKAASHQRVIYWKDSKAWVDHMREFGGGQSIYAQTMQTLAQGARSVALMEKLGTNPAGNLNTIIRRIEEKYRSDADGLTQFRKDIASVPYLRGSLQDVMGKLDGTANIPANQSAAEIFNTVMTAEAMAHLGGVSVTHLAAAPMTVSAELAHHGESHLGSIGSVLQAVLSGRGSAEKQEILADAGAYAHGYNVALHSQWKPGGGVPGFAAAAATRFMRLTGLPWLLDSIQAKGVKHVIMAKLGRAAGDTLDKVDETQSALLRRYGINELEWDALRSGPERTADGRRYLTPTEAETADRSKIEAIVRNKNLVTEKTTPEELDRLIRKERWELGDKYGMYLNDAAEHATVTPGIKESAAAYSSTRPGTLAWMFMRSFNQFKMWPMAAVNQIVGREIGYRLSNKQAAANIGWILALSAAGGALRMSVNDLATGRPQRNYLDWKTLGAALAQGGGLGIYGDFLFGETNRLGGGLIGTAAGPIWSDGDRLLQMYHRFLNDLDTNPAKATQHLWPDLAHFAVGHIPFANLIYLKGALDYLAFYHLYEAASPGWWERTNRRLQKEQGRTMSGYSPGAPIPWTPWALGATR